LLKTVVVMLFYLSWCKWSNITA